MDDEMLTDFRKSFFHKLPSHISKKFSINVCKRDGETCISLNSRVPANRIFDIDSDENADDRFAFYEIKTGKMFINSFNMRISFTGGIEGLMPFTTKQAQDLMHALFSFTITVNEFFKENK